MAISNEILPYGSPFLALFCMAPLYIAAYRSKSYKESFVIFAIQIVTVHLISSFWLANFHGFAAFTLGASAAGTAFEGGMFGILAHTFAGSSSAEKKLMEKSGKDFYGIFKRMLWFSAVWVLYEYVKSVGAMGYPWGTLSMAAYSWKIFTQMADTTGVWGITFIYCIFNGLFAESIMLLSDGKSAAPARISNCRQALLFTVSIFAISGIYGIIQYCTPREPEKNFNIVLVQQNCDPWASGDEESIRISKDLTTQGMEKFKEELLVPDLVVWSEGVLSKNFPYARNYYSSFPEDKPLTQFISKMDTPFLIGGGTITDLQKRKIANSAILFDKNGEYSGFYSKIQLVPFAEKIPYADNPLMNAFMNNVVGFTSTLTSGFQYVLFKIPLRTNEMRLNPLNTDQKPFETIALDSGGRRNAERTQKYIDGAGPNPYKSVSFTTPICFEDSFPAVCRALYSMGSELFLNITNDSWSETKSAEIQHFIVASYLAIEFRTTLVRCANSGLSVVVDPAGKILEQLPLFEEAYGAWKVPVYQRNETFYAKYGDWFAATTALCVFIYLAWLFCQIHDIRKKLSERISMTVYSAARNILMSLEENKIAQIESPEEIPNSTEEQKNPETTETAGKTPKAKRAKGESKEKTKKLTEEKKTSKSTSTKTKIKEVEELKEIEKVKKSAAKKTTAKNKAAKEETKKTAEKKPAKKPAVKMQPEDKTKRTKTVASKTRKTTAASKNKKDQD